MEKGKVKESKLGNEVATAFNFNADHSIFNKKDPSLQKLPDSSIENNILSNKDFESFLKKKGLFSYLEFIWASQGMKTFLSKDIQRNIQLVNCIYNTFITSGSLSGILSNPTLLQIVEKIMKILHKGNKINLTGGLVICAIESDSDSHWDLSSLFDKAEVEVKSYLETVLFPEFKKECEKQLKRQSLSQRQINPDTFAKELSNRMEALELEVDEESHLKRARLSSNSKSKCLECLREEEESQKKFSQNLAKAIEAKLMQMRRLEDVNFGQKDESSVHHAKNNYMEERCNMGSVKRTEERNQNQGGSKRKRDDNNGQIDRIEFGGCLSLTNWEKWLKNCSRNNQKEMELCSLISPICYKSPEEQ